MPEFPTVAHHRDRLAAEAGRMRSGTRPDRRVTAALGAIAVGLGSMGAILFLTAPQARVPTLPPLALLAAALALSAAIVVDRRGLRREASRLAEENRILHEQTTALVGESEEARRKAETANAAKSRFLAMASHEFRTPLNGILGLSGLLIESGLAPDQETYARAVRSSGEELLRLVDDLLDFSKIEAGRLDLLAEPTDLRALAEDVVEFLAPRAHDKGVEIAADVSLGLPSVSVDRMRLRQVLLNLVGNGVKFTEKGSVVLAVQALPATAGGGAHIRFRIADTGPGIDAANAGRIFAEFEQLDDGRARRHGGAGLGLPISQRIVRAMGGEIALHPRPGGGSVFGFDLALPIAAEMTPETVPLDRRRFLILAPEGAEAEFARAVLGSAGADVRLAGTLVEAAGLLGAAAAAATPYEAVFVDARAASDPSAALVTLRQAAGSRLPAAILVKPAGRGRLAEHEAGGFDAYLVRPMRAGSLLRIADEILGSARGFRTDPADRPASGHEANRRAGSGREVLIAEDNEINALLVRAVVEKLGHVATVVGDGASALREATESPGRFAHILMDLHMPGLDGLEAARAIRAFERATGAPRATILALTADVLPETRDNAMAAGIDALAEKPVAPEALRRLIIGAAAD
jgi:signal transduction histidine kinase/AmiR/NasT family two-component response regulator